MVSYEFLLLFLLWDFLSCVNNHSDRDLNMIINFSEILGRKRDIHSTLEKISQGVCFDLTLKQSHPLESYCDVRFPDPPNKGYCLDIPHIYRNLLNKDTKGWQ